MTKPALRLAASVALLVPATAWAQASQCSLPASIPAVSAAAPDGPVRRLPTGSYTLSASWSPEHCRTDHDPASIQCSGRNGRFGFVLHGLWPDGRGKLWPQWCRAAPPPSPAMIRANLCLTPSPTLIAHEWGKHGTCMAPTPERYYRTAGRLWRTIIWPDTDRLAGRSDLTAGMLRAAFVAKNPRWKPSQVGLLVSDAGWLQEVRLCYSVRLRPTACRPDTFGPAAAKPLKIWPEG